MSVVQQDETMIKKINEMHISPNELGIFWLWQNSYIIKDSQGTLVAIDPYLVKSLDGGHIREPPVKPEEMQVDYVFCTHDHLDHCDPKTLPIIREHSPKTRFLGTPECFQRFLEAGIPPEFAQSLEPGVTIALKGFKVTPIYAVPPKIAASNSQTTHYSYIFNFKSACLYNFGDSTSETVDDPMSVLNEAIKHHPDIAIFPIVGDFPERKPEDAVSFTKILKPKVVIPSHYGCFKNRTINPKIFLSLMKEISDVKTVILKSGGSYVYNASSL